MPADILIRSAGRTPPDQPRRFAALDALRGAAALMIFATHAPAHVAGLLAFQTGLRGGVVIFFALSGFLIFREFVSAFDSRTRPVDLRAYATRRLLRIFPAYIFATVVLSVLTGDKGALSDPFGQAAMIDTPIAIVWSLRVELVFYALLPFIAAALQRTRSDRRIRALAIIALASIVALATESVAILQGHLGLVPPFMEWLGAFWQFIPGMIVAVIVVQQPKLLEVLGRWPVLAIGLATLFVGIGLNLEQFDLPDSIAAGILIAFIVARPEPSPRVAAAFAALGGMSYAFYLWHHEILGLLGSLDPWLATLIGFGATAAISFISWLAIERPMIGVARRLTRPRQVVAAVPAA